MWYCLAGSDICGLTWLGTVFFLYHQCIFRTLRNRKLWRKKSSQYLGSIQTSVFLQHFYVVVSRCVQTEDGLEVFFNHKCDLKPLRKLHISAGRAVASTPCSFTAELTLCLLHKHGSVDGKTEQTLNVAKGILNPADVTVAAFGSEHNGCSPDTALALSRFTVSFITFLH